MKIEWHISDDDVRRIKALLDKQADNALVRNRKRRNLAEMKPCVEKQQFWTQMVAMRLTSVQRSGPDSHVARFIRTSPFPLTYEAIYGQKDLQDFIAEALKEAGGIRFPNKIAEHLAANFHRLESGEWTQALRQCNRLRTPAPPDVEREVAAYIQDTFDGFGPKQSRNLLQGLALTRHEIPIDSRVMGWLNEFGFPVRLREVVPNRWTGWRLLLGGIP